MIVEGLTGLATWLLGSILEMFQGITLPLNYISTLIDIMKFGVWVLGADLYNIIITTIIYWLSIKFTAGIVLFIWRLLPLT